MLYGRLIYLGLVLILFGAAGVEYSAEATTSDAEGSNPTKSAEPGSAPEAAAPIGITVKTTIERGDAYLSPQLYNLEITLLEVIRGKSVAELSQVQSVSARLPKDGFEYILARIRLGYFLRARGGPGDEVYTLTEGQFAAVSADGGTEYEVPAVLRQPQPALIDVTFNPGDSHEGWILFQVPKEEKKPLLIFKRQHAEGAYGIWGYIWFKLY